MVPAKLIMIYLCMYCYCETGNAQRLCFVPTVGVCDIVFLARQHRADSRRHGAEISPTSRTHWNSDSTFQRARHRSDGRSDLDSRQFYTCAAFVMNPEGEVPAGF